MGKKSKKTEKAKLLALTVGGAPRPLAISIGTIKPAQVIFFASAGSVKSIMNECAAPVGDARDERGILQMVREDFGFTLSAAQISIVTVPHQELHGAVDAMRVALTQAAERGFAITLDPTGGTKLMSAALALAGQHVADAFTYVAAGGREGSRDKGGLGVTTDGSEVILDFENPADLLEWEAIEDARVLYASGAWGPGAQLLRRQHRRMTDTRRRPAVDAIAHIGEAMAAWERFDHGAAAAHLLHVGTRRAELGRVLGEAATKTLLEELESLRSRAVELARLPLDRNLLMEDLLAAAERSAEAEDYDRAVLLSYRVVEMAAEWALTKEHGFTLDRLLPADLPEGFLAAYGINAPRSGFMKLGLQQRYELLVALGDPLGERFAQLGMSTGAENKTSLELRHDCILVHGIRRCDRGNWKEIRFDVHRLLQVDEESFVRFPKI